MSSVSEHRALVLAACESHLVWEQAEQEDCQRWEEEDFTRQMAELEVKEEEEWKVQKAEEWRVWEERSEEHTSELQSPA